MEYLLAPFLGMMFGVMSGVLPGIGHLLSIILAMPLLLTWSAMEIFLFYIIMVQVSQFLGSLTTIFTQVPGETSSIPLISELKNVHQDRISELLASTAIGSMLGMLIAVAICYFLFDVLSYSSYIYRSEVMVTFLGLAMFVIFCLGKDPAIVKIVMMVTGALLGLVGYNQVFETNILTFGYTPLMTGIPASLVLICIFAMPQLYKLRQVTLLYNFTKINFKCRLSSLKLVPSSSLLGFVGGLVPGLAAIASSQLAHSWSKMRSQDPVMRITAAETANNAGAISQMIPMLVLALPIVNSEALVLAMMESKGYAAGLYSAKNYMVASLLPLLLGAVVALIAAWPLSLLTLKILRLKVSVLRTSAILFLLAVVFYQSWVNMQMIFFSMCFIVLGLMGWCLRKYDPIIMIFAYFISERFLDNFMRVLVLY